MNKAILWAVIFILIVVGFGLFLGKIISPLAIPGDIDSVPLEQNIEKPAQSKTVSSTIAALMQEGKPLKCTADLATAENKPKQKATFYVTAAKMRNDVTIGGNGNTSKIHVIIDNEWQYVWKDGQTSTEQSMTPSKLNIGALTASAGAADESMPILNQQMELACSPWTADETVFTPPSDIEFKDITLEILKPGQSATTTAENK